MFYLLIVLVSILPVGFGEGRFWDKGSEEDLVYENLGLKAEKIGMISLVDDHALISVVIKLPNFKASIKPASNKERGLIDACCGDFLDHDLGKSRGIPASQSTFQILFKENYLKLIRSYQLRADKFLESRMNILEPYVLPSQLIRHARRSKRQLLAFLGSTVLSFAMGAVSEYQMYKINQHINSNSEAIKDLKLRLDQEQKMIIALKNGIIALQIGDAILSSPHIPRDPISMVNLSSHLTPFDFVDSKEVSKVFGDICEKYNSSLSELITPTVSHTMENKDSGSENVASKVQSPKDSQDDLVLANTDDEMEFLDSITVSIETAQEPFEATLSPFEANVSEETATLPLEAPNSLPLDVESSLSPKEKKESMLSLETLVTKLKALFTTPPHNVNVEEANSLASKLWRTNEEILMRIGEAIRTLHPTDENLFEDLILWRKALRYEHALREDLLDLLYQVFYKKTAAEIQREDIRSRENSVTIFRYPINGYLITNYKRFLRKSAPLPNPPKGWHELMGIPSNVRLSRNNRGKDVRSAVPSGSRSTNANLLTDQLKELQKKQSELTENYTSEYTRLTEIISYHEKILMEAKAEATQVAQLFQRDLESLQKQQLAIRDRMERNTSAVSTPQFKQRVGPYRQPPRDRPSQSSHSGGYHRDRPSQSSHSSGHNSCGHSMAHNSRSQFASFGNNTDHLPKLNHQVQPKRPTDRFPLAIVTGPHVKKLAGVAPVREAAVSLILEEMKQKKSVLAPTLESTDQATHGFDLESGINWDQQVLFEKLPRESPNHMGKTWSEEVSTFDVSSLNMFNLSNDVKTSLTGVVYKTLSRKVSSFEQYKAVLEHLALLVEECSLKVILELVNNSDAVLGHVTWNSSVSAEDKKFHLTSHVKLRTSEFIRELSYHLALAEDRLSARPGMVF
ncbi:hypothetical protein ACHWQZ_G017860 [Mnemiopsis leidyi]